MITIKGSYGNGFNNVSPSDVVQTGAQPLLLSRRPGLRQVGLLQRPFGRVLVLALQLSLSPLSNNTAMIFGCVVTGCEFTFPPCMAKRWQRLHCKRLFGTANVYTVT
jgi:hypothetical protein